MGNFGTSKEIVLDLYQDRYISVNVAEGDIDSRKIIVTVTDDGKPYILDASTITARIRYMKSDGNPVLNDCKILSNGTIQIEFTDQMTAVAGRCDATLMLIDTVTQAVLHTMSFIVNVKASAVPSGEIESTPEFTALEHALLKVDTFNEQIDEYIQKAEDATEVIEGYQQEALETKETIESYVGSVQELEQMAIASASNVSIAETEVIAAKENTAIQVQEIVTSRDNAVTYEAEALESKNNILAYEETSADVAENISNYMTTAEESVTRINEVADTYENEVIQITNNEEQRVLAEIARASSEEERKSNEEARISSEAARETNEQIRITNENVRVSNENIRIEAEDARENAENERDSAEAIRINNENARISAENERISAETNRVSAEETRELNETNRNNSELERQSSEETRETNENARVSAETIRQTNEESRISNEATRKLNEEARIIAENNRVSSEKDRSSAEAIRVTNEDTRTISETTRESNEAERIANENIRIANENARLSAEEERQTNTDSALASINETIEQSSSVIAEAQTAVNIANEATSKANTAVQEANTLIEKMESLVANDNLVHVDKLGIASGVATLDENGYVPSSQLPGFVDDVLDGTYDEENNQFLDLNGNVYTPESGKLYIDVDTRKSYRWSGTIYVELTSSIELGTTSSTAFPGDRGLTVENKVTALEEYHNNIPASDIKFDNSSTDLLSANVQAAIVEVSSDVDTHVNNNDIHITSTERTNWNLAKTHADSAHAPSDAQANVIETVKVNGTALTPSSKAVNVTVPTKISELTNDSGYKTTDSNTTYSLSKSGSTITLTGSDGSTTSVLDSDTNTWRPLGTTADTACAGNDSRLSNARPASDVYAWAKASTKPSYSYNEISGTPSSLPANGGTSNYTYLVNGIYTGNGGIQPPSYIENGKVRFNMMNCFKGLSNLPYYADCILMDTYSGSDVPYVTGLGIIKASGNPRAFIAVGEKGNSTTWASQAELITTANIGSQSVNYASSAGNADTLDGNHASHFAVASHTHNYAGSSSAGGDATNALKLNGFSTAESAVGSTIPLRTSGGYLFATYFNQSSGAETPSTSSYIMYANSDGYLRKSTLANVKSILGLGDAAYKAVETTPSPGSANLITSGAVYDLKKSVADGKAMLATTISNQGVTTASDATFETINTNIGTLATKKYNSGYNVGNTEGYKAGQSMGYNSGYNTAAALFPDIREMRPYWSPVSFTGSESVFRAEFTNVPNRPYVFIHLPICAIITNYNNNAKQEYYNGLITEVCPLYSTITTSGGQDCYTASLLFDNIMIAYNYDSVNAVYVIKITITINSGNVNNIIGNGGWGGPGLQNDGVNHGIAIFMSDDLNYGASANQEEGKLGDNCFPH